MQSFAEYIRSLVYWDTDRDAGIVHLTLSNQDANVVVFERSCLTEPHLDVRLVRNHENEKVHARSPNLITDAPARGKTILKSVNHLGMSDTYRRVSR